MQKPVPWFNRIPTFRRSRVCQRALLWALLVGVGSISSHAERSHATGAASANSSPAPTAIAPVRFTFDERGESFWNPVLPSAYSLNVPGFSTAATPNELSQPEDRTDALSSATNNASDAFAGRVSLFSSTSAFNPFAGGFFPQIVSKSRDPVPRGSPISTDDINTNRYWSGNGGSDNISDSNNWFNGTPNSSDSLNWNNTTGSHHFSYFNYGDYYTFGHITFFNGAGGGQLYGNALKFTDYLQNNNDPNQWRIYNSNVSATVSSGSTFYIISNGGGLYFKLDGSGGMGSASTGSLYLDYDLEVQGGSAITFENIIANGGSHTGNVTITNTSTVTYAGTAANTYSGTTTISSGTLSMSKGSAGVDAIAGNIVIQGGTLQYGTAFNNQINDSAKMTITSGTFAVGARTETIGQTATATSGLSMSGGAITISSGQLNVANSAVMTGGTVTISSSGILQTNTDFNFSGGTIDSTYTGSSTAALNLRGGTGTGITYSSSGTSAAQITNSGGGSFGVSLNTTAGATTVFNIQNSPTVATELAIAVPITGGSAGGIQKTGAGVLSLTGANTFTGPTAINGGTLQAAVGTLVSTSSVTVNSSGTLLLSGSGRHIGANTVVTLNGGTFNTGGFSEPTTTAGGNNIGALTLTATSVINFGTGNSSILEFGGVGTHTAGTLLQVTNWDGTPVVGGSGDRLLFSGTATDFTTKYNQTDVSFNGMTGYAVDQFSGYYEVTGLVPVPEPTTILGGLLALGTLGYSQRRRLGQLAGRLHLRAA